MADMNSYKSKGLDIWIKGFHVVETYVEESGYNQILIYNVAELSPYGFDLKGTFESGQCFRWKMIDADHYFGIVREKAVTVSLIDKQHLQIENATANDFSEIWYDYFDLSTDYAPIILQVDKDEFLHKAVTFSGGARMLCQDFEETLFSYILSAQNNIPRIKKLVENLCLLYGNKIYKNSPDGLNSDEILGFSFPKTGVLSKHFCLENYSNCRANNLCGHPFAGYRCPYIRKTASMLESKSVVLDFPGLASMSAKDARREMCRFAGVGEKVADCVLLYSGIRKDLCPIDTWVEKTIRLNYLDPDSSKNEIRAFTESYFGKYAGYAQLWFFNYARNNNEIS